MLDKHCATWISTSLFCLAITGAAPVMAGGPDSAGGVTRFADDYKGYHLRPPYYLPGTGWSYPAKDKCGHASYWGYHFHEPAYPVPNRRARNSAHPGDVRSRVAPSAHVEWCSARYNSYRTYDNSFQPYRGLRKQCQSPYS